MGQPGNVNASRLGISNFWDFNSFDWDKRNFLNNFIIKKLLIYLFSYSSIKLNNLFYNNKWFPVIKHITPCKMLFYKQQMAKLHYREEITYYYVRYRVFIHFSSKIQIMRARKWIFIIWYLYSQDHKQIKFNYYLNPKLLKEINDRQQKLLKFGKFVYKNKFINKILLLKIFFFFKFYNFKMYNNNFTNLFLYNI